MDSVKIISDNGVETNVNGIFYIFNSKYYFIYTEGELDENEYVKLYLVQVCKEIQNTPTGPVDTGYMLGMEITDQTEWQKVQESITSIVNDKKNGTVSSEIQYLPINMLVNLKIVSKNKFRLLKHIIEENFKVVLPVSSLVSTAPVQSLSGNTDNNIDATNSQVDNDVIIDYRAKFFEEQEKNEQLQEQINNLQEKLNNIRTIVE